MRVQATFPWNGPKTKLLFFSSNKQKPTQFVFGKYSLYKAERFDKLVTKFSSPDTKAVA